MPPPDLGHARLPATEDDDALEDSRPNSLELKQARLTAAGAEAEEAVAEVEVLAMHGAEAESSNGTSWGDRREQQQGSCLPPTRLTKFFTHPPHIYNLHS
jgi:hypothetical protein